MYRPTSPPGVLPEFLAREWSQSISCNENDKNKAKNIRKPEFKASFSFYNNKKMISKTDSKFTYFSVLKNLWKIITFRVGKLCEG